MRNYVAAYLDTKIEETLEALKTVSKKDKVVKIYDSPTLKNIQEQIHYARAQGFEGLKLAISEMENANEFISELNESYGYLFKEGIGLVKLSEDNPVEDLFKDDSQGKQEFEAARQTQVDARLMSEQKHTMYIVNPIGIIPFKSENNVCKEIINYIKAAKQFKEEYGEYCNSVYIADFVPLNNKAATRFNSAVYLKDNLNWIKSDKCNLPEDERKELLDFFSDEIAVHKRWSTQDSLVHEVGMIGNYLFGPNIFWVNLTGFHLNNNKNINKYNTQVNNKICDEVLGPKDERERELITPSQYLAYEKDKFGFYFGWGNGAKKNELPSIEKIGDTFFNQFKNCCRELAVIILFHI